MPSHRIRCRAPTHTTAINTRTHTLTLRNCQPAKRTNVTWTMLFFLCAFYTYSHRRIYSYSFHVYYIPRIPANNPIKPSSLPSPTHQEGHNTNTLKHTPHHTLDQPKRRETEKRHKKKKKRWRRRSKERRSQEENIDSIGFFHVSLSLSLCPSLRIDYITRIGCVFVYIFFIKSSFHVLSVHGN